MPRRMTDAEAHDYRMFQRESDRLRKEGKTDKQIGVASNMIDDSRAARKLRMKAGGDSLLKPWNPVTNKMRGQNTEGRQPNGRGGGNPY